MKQAQNGFLDGAESADDESDQLLDLSWDTNPLGPPEWIRQLLNRHLGSIAEYPDANNRGIRRAAAELHGVSPDQIVAASGTGAFITVLPRLRDIARVVLPVPAHNAIRRAGEALRLAVSTMPIAQDDDLVLDLELLGERLKGVEETAQSGGRTLVWLEQPSSATGLPFDGEAFARLCHRYPRCLFAVDESFAGFVPEYTSLASLGLSNVVAIRSLSRFYAVPGLRCGYIVSTTELCESIRELLPTRSVSTLAQRFAEQALRDVEYQERSRAYVAAERDRLLSTFHRLSGVNVTSGQASFLLLRFDELRAEGVIDRLRTSGIVVRGCDDYEGLSEHHLRIGIRTKSENDRFIDALSSIIAPSPARRRSPKRAARIMLQGTASNAGKSVLTTAMCRLLLRQGVRVAPFKAQNMSLNSFVTADGGEMGRAQVVQAQACRIEPDVRMNPVLLKPSSETGSQVILCGRPVANIEAKRYFTDKTELFAEVCRCYDELSGEYDALVLEGAGSPGEVNLKKYDMVNMRMAAYADAPVLLVGDIDRGGVFASFIGTMDVLDEWERRLLRGFLINKFRGEVSLLAPAIDYTFDYTGKPTFGVVPMIRELGIPDEDSVSFKIGRSDPARGVDGSIVCGVVDLPHISNFTDFDPLEHEPDVEVRIVRRVDDLEGCDAIIIPGSKNVFADLHYLRETGIAGRIVAAADGKTCAILGVCGGYQMLGRRLSDPSHLESETGVAAGLSLLEVDTELGEEKVLSQTAATHLPTGLAIRGYEIHHGRTAIGDGVPWMARADGEVIGVSHRTLAIHGTYLHGLFDDDRFRRAFVDGLRVRRGMEPVGEVVSVFDIEPAIDRLADIVAEHVEVDRILELMGL